MDAAAHRTGEAVASFEPVQTFIATCRNAKIGNSIVTAAVADADGSLVPQAVDRIRSSIDGPGGIVATDNSDPSDLDPFPARQRNAFNGLCLAIVCAKPGQTGTITLKAESGTLEAAAVTLQTTSDEGRDLQESTSY